MIVMLSGSDQNVCRNSETEFRAHCDLQSSQGMLYSDPKPARASKPKLNKKRGRFSAVPAYEVKL